MANNLNVDVTADSTQLRAQLAIAKAELATYSAAVKATAKDIAASGQATAEQTAALEKGISAQRTAQSAVSRLASEMQAGTGATKTAATAIEGATGAMKNHGAASEAMVLVHEAMQGRFNKMAGSAMILTQRLGNVSLALQGMIGVMAVAALGAAHLWEMLEKVGQAKLAAQAGGLGSGMSNAFLDAQVDKVRKLKDSTAEMAGQVVHSFTQLRGITQPVMEELTSDVRALALRMGSDLPGAAHKIAEAWDLDVKAGAELLQQTRASTAAVVAFTWAAQNDEAIKARTILLRELSRSAHEVATQTREAETVTTRADMAKLRAREGMRGSVPGAPMPDKAKQLIDRAEAVDAGEVAIRLASAIRNVNDARKATEAQPWSEQMKLDLEKTTLELERQGHAQGQTWQQIHQAMAQTSVDFWQKEFAGTKAGTKNHEFAERQLYTAMEQLEASKIHTDAAGAKQALETRIAQLSAEQAANRDNFVAVMQLEDQKLALLRGAGAAYSVQYQEELRRREEMVRQHNAQIARLSLEHITKQEEIDRQAFGEAKANLDAQVADHLITRQEEIRQLLAYADQLYAVEHQALANFIDTQNLEVAERQKALDQMAQMEATHSRTQAALRAQMAQADRQDQQRILAGYEQMFTGIEGAARTSVAGLITGTMTWQQAERRVATQMLDSAVSLTASVAERWAASELAKTFATEAGIAQRVAAQQAEGASGWGAILSSVARWVTGEETKTAATTAGVAVRTTEQAAGATAGAVIERAANQATIGQDAAKAAAGAYSAVAGIPIIGPFLAPVAAGVAFAAVEAFGSFDRGLDYVPQDMVAQIHQGEMIVPKYDADRIRGGGGGGDAFHYAPTIHVNGGGTVGSALESQVQAAFRYFQSVSRNGALALPGRRL